MSLDMRTDDAHIVSYPTAPDARGSARIYHHRKSYYLGQHGSPLSYVMFGIWKQGLLETGDAPTSVVVREQAEAVLNQSNYKSILMKRYGLTAAAITLSMVVGLFLGAKFLSTSPVANVDGISLSASENDFIRGIRKNRAGLSAGVNSRLDQTSQQLLSLLKGDVNKDEIAARLWNR